MFKNYSSFIKTSCLGTPAESTAECSPVKLWSVKSLPSGRGFHFPTPQCILRSVVHPGAINE